MKVSYICSDIYKWIQVKERYGVIHSIFKNVINILSEDGKFVPIIVNNKPMSPNSIKLKDKLNLEKLNIEVNQKLIFTKDLLIIKDIILSYKEATLWDKGVKLIYRIDTYENFQLKLNIVGNYIFNKGNKDGIYGLMKFIPGNLFALDNIPLENKSQLFIKDRFINFINSFKNHHTQNINRFSKKIIGYGPGLTPSMDDFLSGMMIANIYISYFLDLNLDNAYLLNHEIVKDIDNMTTRVSEEMLKLSSLGQANEDIRDLMLALIGIDIGKAELEKLLAKVSSFGHSSGTDILCGIFMGSRILVDKYDKQD